jgi:hypothetical protein
LDLDVILVSHYFDFSIDIRHIVIGFGLKLWGSQ